ncbi:4-hydroxythreonine-4-phosphate dehydrogenase PdxA [Peribacillus cavernae]|uniref:4-hydroxythreonine-4-phosphate dehydrogenase PdxA n=1 Tax=Peribacillus cavernae TaxID=1674310 RepID=A0A3S0VLG7_9BACI|nr:4-hydroxythreonine-4-phosphate dehydrogenase PdxA [Peribacillus cavernae]MDQ0217695.1 4-hydroxythreonine-4-phosphate dehydrogenase [Peribacillus cavernae]RUQ28165.1 4-hydroxythreonine-4-phosphate dehydrogenase PdxA [Peribacillus cavernae]
MTETSERPIIAIPMGDPAGIGPEITVKALSKGEIYEVCRPIMIGNKEVMNQAIGFAGLDLYLNTVANPSEGKYQHGTIDIIHSDNVDIQKLQVGEVQAMCGQAAFDYIKTSIEFANAGIVDAIATTPINKESLKAANVPYIGHTEMLAGLTGVDDPLTMFEVHSLRIFFLTRHLSLKDAIGQITAKRVYDYLHRCTAALNLLGIDNPKIAVAGLNPHSGEHGLFGREEVDEIEPGVKNACKDGIHAFGPVPADSVFHQALHGKYDAVLSLYHDQGHIAAKMTDFERTISITNGLPFLRTSVDHGTAFDIAGTGIAASVSMEEAIKLAAKYAKQFRAAQKA